MRILILLAIVSSSLFKSITETSADKSLLNLDNRKHGSPLGSETKLYQVLQTGRTKRELKDVDIELLSEESKHKNRRLSYNHKSAPRRHQYQNHNRHSDGRKGKGGYHKSDSYKGNKGYSDYSTYNRANKDSYGDADHKQYGNRDGGKYGGGKSGGNAYGGSGGHSTGGHGSSGGQYGGGGGGKYASEYSDNSRAYLSAGGEY